ncbi:unnamed protein product, partial [Rotaria magnacalcarata]
MAHLIIADALGFGEQPVKAVGAGHGAVDLGVFQQQQEFAAGDARRRVAGLQAHGQATAGFAQHFPDALGTEAFVDHP